MENAPAAPTPAPETEGEPLIALLFCTDLFFGVRLQSTARAAGFRPVTVRSGDPLPRGDVLVVDLAAKGDWEVALREATSRNVPALAFGPHTDTAARVRAKNAGATRLLSNSNLARDLPRILAAIREGSSSLPPDQDAGHDGE